MTSAQRAVLNTLRAAANAGEPMPTNDEIAFRAGISTAHDPLVLLERDGYIVIERGPGRQRRCRIVSTGQVLAARQAAVVDDAARATFARLYPKRGCGPAAKAAGITREAARAMVTPELRAERARFLSIVSAPTRAEMARNARTARRARSLNEPCKALVDAAASVMRRAGYVPVYHAGAVFGRAAEGVYVCGSLRLSADELIARARDKGLTL